MLKEAYEQVPEYNELMEKRKANTARLKQVKEHVNQDYQSEVTKLEDLRIDLASDQELLNDIALSTMFKGETVEVKDTYEQLYLPIFKVTFKKQ